MNLSKIFCFVFLSSVALANDSAIQKMNADGGELKLGSFVPGKLELREPAFAVLEDANASVVVAAGENKSGGKVVAFSHGKFLIDDDFAKQADYQKFLKNAIGWATGDKKNPKIGVSPGTSDFLGALEKIGLKGEIFPATEIGEDVDLFVVKGESTRELGDAGLAKIDAHVKRGGAVFVAATPWPFGKNFPDFSQFPPNRIVADFGIEFLENGYASNKRPLLILTGADESPIVAAEKLTTKVSDESIADLRKGVFLKGEKLDRFLVALKKLNESVGPIIPSKKSPVVPGDVPLVDAIVEVETALNLRLPAGKMYAIPAAQDYPGGVPADAAVISKSLTIDATYRGWATGRSPAGWNAKEMRPTGIYAAPGTVIEVVVPKAIVDAGFEVVIGSYNGGLSNRKRWERYPKLQRAFPILTEKTQASNGLGGIVTIRIPRDAVLPPQPITIAGGVAAPLYIHGETSLENWREKIRHAPGPWAEIASDRMIVTVPSDHIRDLDDPDKVAEAWISYIEKSAELAQLNREKFRAERLVFDRQTAAGWMHSGYPVAAHLGGDSRLAVNSEGLMTKGSWGFFHEYGHNHQHDLWMLPGTGETTCNLWSVYLFEELIGKNRDGAHGAMAPLKRRLRTGDYFRKGADFKNWSVWTALDTYLFVQEEFGWEPFQKTFAAYNAMPESAWPKTQQQKNDEWVIQLSKACGKNLAPFWGKWNLPLTDRVEKELADLEVWECEALEAILKE